MNYEAHVDRNKITVLTEDECKALITTTTVGWVAFVDDDGQQLVPVNFAVLAGVVYLRTLPDGFLAELARDHEDVAFGVSFHAQSYRSGWNVTVKGSAAEVEDRATVNMVLGHERLRPWAGGVRPLVIRITMDSIAGRRVSEH
jgi:nitroimidazol reductase NimA-like FMN-containing flavoprotein (pyridoxamine 5'-phosphate oxidase superfamily)